MHRKTKQRAIAVAGALCVLLAVIVLAAGSGGGTAEDSISNAYFVLYIVMPFAMVLAIVAAVKIWRGP